MKSYCDFKHVYSVREIIPSRWYIQVYWRNPNGRRGGVCKLMDELDGPDCSAKVFESRYKAQKYLDKMAKLCGWEVVKEAYKNE